MGSLFSALNIGRSGLLSAQIQLDVAGHNISNVNTPGFSRQRAMLNTQVPTRFGYGVLGRGVGVSGIERARDPFLDQVFRRQAPAVSGAEVRSRFYALLEDSLHEPGANGFSGRINDFFDSVNDFANNVEILPTREALLAEAQTLATSLNQLGDRFALLRTDANNGISAIVDELNAQAAQVARLNDQITRLESSGREANDLRDERDAILDDLARLADVTVRENDNGQVDILIGNGTLVTGAVVQRLEAVRNPAIDPSRPDFVEVRFAGSGRVIDVQDGELGAAFDVRDTIVPSFQDRLDSLARTFIREVNNVHAQGQGLENLSGTLVSDNAVSASGDPLVSAGLPFDVTPGTFDIVTYDAAGTPTTTTISITAATSLDDLASDISAIGGLSAAVSGGRLEITAAAPTTYRFASDDTGALAALGLNSFFTGTGASSIGVSQRLVDNAALVSSGFTVEDGDAGDNTAALALAALQNTDFLDGATSTISEYYESTIAQLGVESRANATLYVTDQAVIDDISQRRQEVQGVSLDEEVANLIQVQRAFEASARIITVTDRMLETLLSVGL